MLGYVKAKMAAGLSPDNNIEVNVDVVLLANGDRDPFVIGRTLFVVNV